MSTGQLLIWKPMTAAIPFLVFVGGAGPKVILHIIMGRTHFEYKTYGPMLLSP